MTMSINKSVQGDYSIDVTPLALPDGRFAARAVLTRRDTSEVKELRPEFEPFSTEAEAVTAAQIAALAWVSHPSDES